MKNEPTADTPGPSAVARWRPFVLLAVAPALALALASCDSVEIAPSSGDEVGMDKRRKITLCHVGSEEGPQGQSYDPACLPSTENGYFCPDAGKIDLIEVSISANHLNNPAHCYKGVCDYLPREKGASGVGKRDADGDGVDDGCEIPDDGHYTNSIGIRFKRIPHGSYLRGSTALGDEYEQPVHTVILTRDFYLGVFEVTQKQWKAIKGTDPSYFRDCPGEVYDNCPTERVSWYDVIGFANDLSVVEGLPACYDGMGHVIDPVAGGNVYRCRGYRLPTEAEWEYAARAGTSTSASRRKPCRHSSS